MTAAATQVLAAPGGIVADIDLWYPDQEDPVGPDHIFYATDPDPLRYVVWVDAGRWHGNGREFHHRKRSLPEFAPRMALHVNHIRRRQP